MNLLDTHIFVPRAFGVGEAGPAELLEAPLAVSAVTAAEVGCLFRVGRIRLDTSPDVWFDRAVVSGGFTVKPLTPGLLARALSLEWSHRDPADRILVQSLIDDPDLTLWTRDREILRFGAVRKLRVRDYLGAPPPPRSQAE